MQPADSAATVRFHHIYRRVGTDGAKWIAAKDKNIIRDAYFRILEVSGKAVAEQIDIILKQAFEDGEEFISETFIGGKNIESFRAWLESPDVILNKVPGRHFVKDESNQNRFYDKYGEAKYSTIELKEKDLVQNRFRYMIYSDAVGEKPIELEISLAPLDKKKTELKVSCRPRDCIITLDDCEKLLKFPSNFIINELIEKATGIDVPDLMKRVRARLENKRQKSIP
jgi:hypothetical protein